MYEHAGCRGARNPQLEMAGYPVGLYDRACLCDEPGGVSAAEVAALQNPQSFQLFSEKLRCSELDAVKSQFPGWNDIADIVLHIDRFMGVDPVSVDQQFIDLRKGFADFLFTGDDPPIK